MNRSEWNSKYWKYYKVLENKLISTIPYVEISKKNLLTFSNEYAALIQTTGAEIDNFFKVFCNFNLTDKKNISDYADYILKSYPNIRNEIVRIPDRKIELKPFEEWDISAPAKSLSWWFNFDTIKHNRADNIEKANQINLLNSLAALFLLEMKYCQMIAEKDSEGKLIEPDIPDEQSKLFEMKDWEYRFIPLNDAFAIVDGEICMVTRK